MSKVAPWARGIAPDPIPQPPKPGRVRVGGEATSTTDSAYYEKWETRKKRLAAHKATRETRVLHKVGAVKLCGNGKPIDDDMVRQVERLYKQGWSNKRIATEVGIGTSTISRMRREHKWPAKHPSRTAERGSKTSQADYTQILLGEALLARLDKHLRKFNIRNRSIYFRRLVQRDLDSNGS